MINHYLERIGDSLLFPSRETFDSQFAQLDLSVPDRTEKRQTSYRERHCCLRFFDAVVQATLIQFPCTLVKFEDPDFLLIENQRSVWGIEHTDFGPQEYQEVLTLAAKGKLSTVSDESNALQPNFGRVGKDEPRYAKYALSAILHKAAKLKQVPYFATHQRHLILYSMTALNNVDVSEVSQLVHSQMADESAKTGGPQPFASIALVYGTQEIWLDFGSSRAPQRHITNGKPPLAV